MPTGEIHAVVLTGLAPPMNGTTEMTEKLTTYDPAEDLTSDTAIATFMAEAFASEDPGYVAHALGVVARAKQYVGRKSEAPSADAT
jgi:hypothetical protein